MPALATVMKTASKTVDDAVKPIKSTVDHIALKGKQSAKTAITKTQQKVSIIAVNNVKSVQKLVEPVINEDKQRAAIKAASTKSVFSTKVENAIELGKAHLEQLKFAVAHPIITIVTSKAGQKSILGSAKFIDDALRPVEVRTAQTTTGNKMFAGFEQGESSGKLTEKVDHFIAIKQAEKDAIKGIKGTGNPGKHLDDVPKIKKIEVNFNRNVKHDPEEFARQLKDQEKGMNELTVDEYLKNRERYIAEGRAIEGNIAQKMARQEALKDKIAELRKQGLSRADATKQASEWLETKATLHNPDQIAGGRTDIIGGLGDKRVNSSIGSQWKYRIDVVDEQIREIAKNMSPEQLKNTYLNVKLTQ